MMNTPDPHVSSLFSMVRLTPLSSGMRVEWIESKDEIRARRADKKLATQIPVSVERILQDFHPGEPEYVSLKETIVDWAISQRLSRGPSIYLEHSPTMMMISGLITHVVTEWRRSGLAKSIDTAVVPYDNSQ